MDDIETLAEEIEDLKGEIKDLEADKKELEKDNENKADEIKGLNERIEKMQDAGYEIYQM